MSNELYLPDLAQVLSPEKPLSPEDIGYLKKGIEDARKYLTPEFLTDLLVKLTSPTLDTEISGMLERNKLKREKFQASKSNPAFTYLGYSGSVNVMNEVMYAILDSVEAFARLQKTPLNEQQAQTFVSTLFKEFDKRIFTKVNDL